MPTRRAKHETMTFDTTRQGLRNLDQAGNVLPYSSAPEPQAGVGENVGRSERWATALAGGAALAAGVARGSLPGWGLAQAGAALLVRGLTGRCPVYGALGINTAEDSEESASREVVYRVPPKG